MSVGSELYRIADLSKVWVLADTFRDEATVLSPGMEVKVLHPQTKRPYHAMVSKVLPQFDPERAPSKCASKWTTRVRLPPRHVRRPGVARILPRLTVPAESGRGYGLAEDRLRRPRKRHFEPRRVETGWRMGDRVEMTKGLLEGEPSSFRATSSSIPRAA